MTALSDRLDQLEQARAAATPGPWWAWDRGVGWHIVTEDPATVGRGSVPVTLPEGTRTDLARREDAELIVAAVNALPELIAELRRQEAALRAAQQLADELGRDGFENEDEMWVAGLHYAAARLRAVLAAATEEGQG